MHSPEPQTVICTYRVKGDCEGDFRKLLERPHISNNMCFREFRS